MRCNRTASCSAAASVLQNEDPKEGGSLTALQPASKLCVVDQAAGLVLCVCAGQRAGVWAVCVHRAALMGALRPQDVTTVYTLGRVLGRGQFGTTRLAVHKASGKEYACKSIGKRKLLCAPSPALAHLRRHCGTLLRSTQRGRLTGDKLLCVCGCVQGIIMCAAPFLLQTLPGAALSFLGCCHGEQAYSWPCSSSPERGWGVSRTAEDVEDVRREVQIMHHLEGHPNIVKIVGAFEDKHSVHLVRSWQQQSAGQQRSVA